MVELMKVTPQLGVATPFLWFLLLFCRGGVDAASRASPGRQGHAVLPFDALPHGVPSRRVRAGSPPRGGPRYVKAGTRRSLLPTAALNHRRARQHLVPTAVPPPRRNCRHPV